MTVSFQLPFPPSSNGLFANGKNGRRFRSQKYEDWKHEAGFALLDQRPAAVKGPVSLHYVFEDQKDKRKRDLGNLEKAVSDLLVEHQIIEADDHTIVRAISLSWGQVEGVCITVWPHQAQSPCVPIITTGTQGN